MSVINQTSGENWTILNGDCCEASKDIPENSVGYSVFSPPFSSLYLYSDHPADMGNCKGDEEFFTHFKFLIPELLRVTYPGRLCSVHSMQMPTTKESFGYIGIRDFPGDIVRAFQAAGWIYHSRVVIWKDPLVAATHTKTLGLAHKQIVKDSARCRQGIADYLDTFMKPGDATHPVNHHAATAGFTDFIGEDPPRGGQRTNVARTNSHSHAIWRRYASPVWNDIDQTRTLNVAIARESDDERHLCPLQLDVIDRCVDLWTNPGDVVLTPFAGVGSEMYGAILAGRKAVGIELKESYYRRAIINVTLAEKAYKEKHRTLFDMHGENTTETTAVAEPPKEVSPAWKEFCEADPLHGYKPPEPPPIDSATGEYVHPVEDNPNDAMSPAAVEQVRQEYVESITAPATPLVPALPLESHDAEPFKLEPPTGKVKKPRKPRAKKTVASETPPVEQALLASLHTPTVAEPPTPEDDDDGDAPF